MTPKEYLNRYKDAVVLVKQLDKELRSLQYEAGSVGISLDGMPHGTNVSDKTGNYAAKIADMVIEVIEQRTEALAVRREVWTTVGKIKNTDARRVIYMRYLELKRFEEIAVDMNYGIRNVYRLHGEGLQLVGEIIEKECSEMQ